MSVSRRDPASTGVPRSHAAVVARGWGIRRWWVAGSLRIGPDGVRSARLTAVVRRLLTRSPSTAPPAMCGWATRRDGDRAGSPRYPQSVTSAAGPARAMGAASHPWPARRPERMVNHRQDTVRPTTRWFLTPGTAGTADARREFISTTATPPPSTSSGISRSHATSCPGTGRRSCRHRSEIAPPPGRTPGLRTSPTTSTSRRSPAPGRSPVCCPLCVRELYCRLLERDARCGTLTVPPRPAGVGTRPFLKLHHSMVERRRFDVELIRCSTQPFAALRRPRAAGAWQPAAGAGTGASIRLRHVPSPTRWRTARRSPVGGPTSSAPVPSSHWRSWYGRGPGPPRHRPAPGRPLAADAVQRSYPSPSVPSPGSNSPLPRSSAVRAALGGTSDSSSPS